MAAASHTQAHFADACGTDTRYSIHTGGVRVVARSSATGSTDALLVKVEFEAIARRGDTASGSAQRHGHDSVDVEQQDGYADSDS